MMPVSAQACPSEVGVRARSLRNGKVVRVPVLSIRPKGHDRVGTVPYDVGDGGAQGRPVMLVSPVGVVRRLHVLHAEQTARGDEPFHPDDLRCAVWSLRVRPFGWSAPWAGLSGMPEPLVDGWNDGVPGASPRDTAEASELRPEYACVTERGRERFRGRAANRTRDLTRRRREWSGFTRVSNLARVLQVADCGSGRPGPATWARLAGTCSGSSPSRGEDQGLTAGLAVKVSHMFLDELISNGGVHRGLLDGAQGGG